MPADMAFQPQFKADALPPPAKTTVAACAATGCGKARKCAVWSYLLLTDWVAQVLMRLQWQACVLAAMLSESGCSALTFAWRLVYFYCMQYWNRVITTVAEAARQNRSATPRRRTGGWDHVARRAATLCSEPKLAQVTILTAVVKAKWL
jgi:hypothetical protein